MPYRVSDTVWNNLISAESGWNPNATSSKGARGLMQIMPATARMLGVDPNTLYDPNVSVSTGERYFNSLVDRYGGDLYKSVAAYNEGPGRVDRGVYLPEAVAEAKKVLKGQPTVAEAQAASQSVPAQAPTQQEAQPMNGVDPSAMAAAPAAMPTAAPQQPGIMGGIERVLSHPLVQGALAAYLGAIGSPSYLGWGGALSRGGLAGLGQLSSAEQLRQQLPLMQAKTQLTQTQAQAAQASLKAKQEAEAFLDSPAGQRMDPTQREMFKAGIATGHYPPAGTFGITPYQQARLDLGKQQIGLNEKRTAADIAKNQAGTAVENARLAGTLPAGPERPDVAAEHASATALNRERLRQLQAGTPQLAKVNTDLGRYFMIHPGSSFTDHDEAVKQATAYATNLNPGADPAAIQAAAEALAPATGFGATVERTLGGGGPTPPANATHEILGPDGSVAGHRGADGKIVWLPGKEPRTSAKR